MLYIYMVTWIPSIYPLSVGINISAPWIRHGIYEDLRSPPASCPGELVMATSPGSNGTTTGVQLPSGKNG